MPGGHPGCGEPAWGGSRVVIFAGGGSVGLAQQVGHGGSAADVKVEQLDAVQGRVRARGMAVGADVAGGAVGPRAQHDAGQPGVTASVQQARQPLPVVGRAGDQLQGGRGLARCLPGWLGRELVMPLVRASRRSTASAWSSASPVVAVTVSPGMFPACCQPGNRTAASAAGMMTSAGPAGWPGRPEASKAASRPRRRAALEHGGHLCGQARGEDEPSHPHPAGQEPGDRGPGRRGHDRGGQLGPGRDMAGQRPSGVMDQPNRDREDECSHRVERGGPLQIPACPR